MKSRRSSRVSLSNNRRSVSTLGAVLCAAGAFSLPMNDAAAQTRYNWIGPNTSTWDVGNFWRVGNVGPGFAWSVAGNSDNTALASFTNGGTITIGGTINVNSIRSGGELTLGGGVITLVGTNSSINAFTPIDPAQLPAFVFIEGSPLTVNSQVNGSNLTINAEVYENAIVDGRRPGDVILGNNGNLLTGSIVVNAGTLVATTDGVLGTAAVTVNSGNVSALQSPSNTPTTVAIGGTTSEGVFSVQTAAAGDADITLANNIFISGEGYDTQGALDSRAITAGVATTHTLSGTVNLIGSGAHRITVANTAPANPADLHTLTLANVVGSGRNVTFQVGQGAALVLQEVGSSGNALGTVTIDSAGDFDPTLVDTLNDYVTIQSQLFANTLTVADGDVLLIDNGTNPVLNVTTLDIDAGAGVRTQDAGGAVYLSGATNVNVDGTLRVLASADTIQNLTGAGSIILDNDGATVNNTGEQNVTLSIEAGSFSGVISSANDAGDTLLGNLTKTNASGTLILSGANTYNGLTTVSAGVLRIENGSALGEAAATTNDDTTVSSGATLELAGGITVGVEEVLTISGAGVMNKAAIWNAANDNTIQGAITLAANSSVGAASVSGVATNLTLSGVISGAFNLTKSGDGTVALTAANTFSGTTTVAGGTLALNALNALQDTTAVTVNSGATLTTNGADRISDTATLTVDGTVTLGGDETVADLSGATTSGRINATTASTLTVAQGNDAVFNGQINDGTGTLTFTKEGGSTLTLTGANGYTGPTNVNDGILGVTGSLASTDLQIRNAATLFTDGGGLSNNAIVSFNNNASTLSLSGSETIKSINSVGGATGSILLNGATLTVDTDGVTPPAAFVVNPTFAGVIADNGGVGALTKTGDGILTLTGVNTYTGATRVNFATLALTGAGSIASTDIQLGDSVADPDTDGTLSTDGAALSNNAVITFNTASSALNIATAGETIRGISSTGTNGLIRLNGVTLTVDTDGAAAGNADYSFGGVISNNGGTGALTKAGGGILTLTGANTYTGATNVTGGTLAVTGSIASTTIDISDGATLSTTGATGLVDGAQVATNANGRLEIRGNETVNAITGTGSVVIYDADGTTTSATDGFTLTIATSGATAFGGVISEASTANGPGNLIKGGTNTLTLNGNNTFSGTTTVSGGTLALGAAGQLSATSAITVDNGAFLTTAAAQRINNSASLTLNGGLTIGGDEDLGTLSGTNAAAFIDLNNFNIGFTSNDNSSFAGSFGAAGEQGRLFKHGTGTLTLSGGNALWEGDLHVTNGILEITNANVFGNTVSGGGFSGGTHVAAGGTARINVAGSPTIAENFFINGAGFDPAAPAVNTNGTDLPAQGALQASASATLGGTVTLEGASSIGVASGQTLTLTGTLTDGAGTHNLTKVGTGTLDLTGLDANNLVNGRLTINSGVVVINSVNDLGSAATNALTPVTFGSETTTTVTGAGPGPGTSTPTTTFGTLRIGAGAPVGNYTNLGFNSGAVNYFNLTSVYFDFGSNGTIDTTGANTVIEYDKLTGVNQLRKTGSNDLLIDLENFAAPTLPGIVTGGTGNILFANLPNTITVAGLSTLGGGSGSLILGTTNLIVNQPTTETFSTPISTSGWIHVNPGTADGTTAAAAGTLTLSADNQNFSGILFIDGDVNTTTGGANYVRVVQNNGSFNTTTRQGDSTGGPTTRVLGNSSLTALGDPTPANIVPSITTDGETVENVRRRSTVILPGGILGLSAGAANQIAVFDETFRLFAGSSLVNDVNTGIVYSAGNIEIATGSSSGTAHLGSAALGGSFVQTGTVTQVISSLSDLIVPTVGLNTQPTDVGTLLISGDIVGFGIYPAFNIGNATAAAAGVGANAVTLSGNNTFVAGQVNLAGGALYLGSDTALGASNNTLRVTGDATLGAVSYAGVTTRSIDNRINLVGATTDLTVNTEAVDNTDIDPTAGVNQAVAAGQLDLTGQISGAGTIIKTGAGTLRLANANVFTGGTTISNGTVIAAHNSALGTGNVTLGDAVNNTVLNLTASNVAIDGTFTTVAATDAGVTSATLSGGSGRTFTAAGDGAGAGVEYALNNGAIINANLGNGDITTNGTVAINNGTGSTGTLAVQTGTTTLGNSASLGATTVSVAGTSTLVTGNNGATGGLASGATVNVAATGTLTLGSSDTITTLNTSGTVGGVGNTLTATTYNLNGGTVDANLGAGTVNVGGDTTLNGTSAAAAVNLNNGILALGSAERLLDTALLTFDAAGTGGLNLLAGNETVGALAGGDTDNTISLNGNTLTLTSGTQSFGGVIDDGNLTIAGANQTLTGVNTYTGDTTLNSGSLTLGTGTGSIASTFININGTSSLTLNAGLDDRLIDTDATVTLNGTDTASRAVLTVNNNESINTLEVTDFGTVAGTGTLTATSVYNLGNGTIINANLGGAANINANGTVALNGNTGTGALNVQSGITTVAGTSGATAINLTGGGSLTTTTLNRLADTAVVSFDNTDANTFSLGGAETIGSLGGTTAGTQGTSDDTVDLNGNVLTLSSGINTFAGVITDGALTVNGATQTLTGANTYTGATTVSGGTLFVTGTGTLASTDIQLSGAGYLGTDGGALASGAVITFNSNGSLFTVGTTNEAIRGISSAVGVGGTIGLANTVTLTLNTAGSDFTFAGVIQNFDGASVGSLTKTGTGTQTLTGQNTYTGTTTVTGGTLALGHATNTLADASALVVNGGTLALGANTDTVNSVQLVSGSITGTGTLTSATTFDVQSGNIAVNLDGAFGLNKTTGGLVTLSGTNTYVGTTTISAGTLALTGSLASIDVQVTGTGVLTSTGGLDNNTTLANNSTGGVTFTGAEQLLNYSGTGNLTATGQNLVVTDTISSTGTISVNNLNVDTLNGSSTINATGSVTVDNGNFGGDIASGNIVKIGASDAELTLTAANTTSGTVSVNGGTLFLNATDALQNTTQVTVGTNGTLVTNGADRINDAAALINNGGDVTFGGAETLASLNNSGQVNPGAGNVLTLTGALTNSGTLGAAQGEGTIFAASFALNGGSVVNSNLGDGNINANGTVAINGTTGSGTLAVQTGTTTFGGDANVGAEIVTIALNSVLNTGTNSALSVDADITNTGTLNIGSTDTIDTLVTTGTVTIVAGATLTADSVTMNGGTLGDVANQGLIEATTYNLNGGTVNADLGTGTVNVGGNATTTLNGASDAGTVNINRGVLALGATGSLNDTAAVIFDTTNAGTLSLTADETIGILSGGTAADSVALNGQTLTLTDGLSVFAGIISNGSLEVDGANQILSGANTYTGDTTVTSGVLTINGTLADTAITVGAGGTLNYNTTDSVSSLTNSGTVDIDDGDVLTVGTLTQNGGTLGNAARTGDRIQATTYNLNGGTVEVDLGTGTIFVGGDTTTVLNGVSSASVVDIGQDDTLTLGANSALNSATSVSIGIDGALNTGASNQIGNNAIVTLEDGATLGLGGNELVASIGAGEFTNINAAGFNLTVTGNLASDGDLDVADLTVGGTLSGNYDITATGAVSVDVLNGVASADISGATSVTANSGTFAGEISGTGEFIKNSSGTLTLSGGNTYTGDTTVNDGTLILSGFVNSATDVTVAAAGELYVNNNNTFATLNNSGEVTVNGNLAVTGLLTNTGTFRVVDGGDVDVDLLAGSFTQSAGSFLLGASATFNVTNDFTLTGGSVDLATGSVLTVSGAFNQTGGTITGTGALNVTGATTLTDVVIAADLGLATSTLNLNGTVEFTSTGSSASTTVNLNDGATLILAGNNLADSATVNIGTGTQVAGITTLRLQGDETIGLVAGTNADDRIQLNGATLTLNGNATGGAIDDVTFAGVISGNGGLTKSGTDIQTLTGANTYTGTTTVSGGGLILSGSGALTNSTNIQITGGTLTTQGGLASTADVTLNSGSLVLTGSETIDVLTGTGGTVTSGAAGTQVLTVGSDNGSGSFAGVIGGGTGTLALVKDGSGVQTLTSANTYTGSTTVNDGELVLSGSGTIASTSIAINGDGVLTLASGNDNRLTGTNVNVTLDGASAGARSVLNVNNAENIGTGVLTVTDFGTVAGTGTLTAGSYALNNGTIIDANLSGAGTLTANGTVLINGTTGSGQFVVASGTTTLAGASASTNVDVNAGTLAVTSGSLNSALTIDVASGATLTTSAADKLGNDAALTNNGILTLGGNDTVASYSSSGLLNGTGVLTATSGYTLNSGSTVAIGAGLGDGTVAVNGTVTVNGTIGSGGISSVVLDAGTDVLNLSGNNLSVVTSLNNTAGTVNFNGADQFAAITANTGTLNVNGLIELTGNLVSSGTIDGTSTITAANYNLSGGTVSAGLGLGDGAVNVNSGTVAISGVVQADTLTVANGATLGLTGATDVDTAIVNGALNLNAALDADTLTVNSTGTLTYTGTSANVGNGTAVIVTGGILALGTNIDTVGSLTTSGLAQVTGTGTLTAATYTLNGGTINANLGDGAITTNNTVAINGTTGTTGSLLVTGGTTTLGNSASLRATTVTINGGSLVTGTNGAAGGGIGGLATSATVINAGILTLGSSDTIATYIGSGTVNGTGLTLTATSYALNGGSVINANLGTGDVIANGAVTINGTVNATPDASDSFEIETGTTTVNGLIGTNDILVRAGATLATDAVSSNNLSDTATVTLNDFASAFATFNVNSSETIAGVVGDQNSRVAIASGTTLFLNGDADGAADTSTFAGVVSGTNGALTKSGTDTQVLTGANTYTGTTTVSGGTLTLDGTNDSLAFVVSGGVLNANRDTDATSVTVSGGVLNVGALGNLNDATNVAITGTGVVNTGALEQLNDGVSILVNGTLNLGGTETVGALTGSGAINGGSNALLVNSGSFSGVISGSGAAFTTPFDTEGNAVSLAKIGTGTLTLSGVNTYTGFTAVAEGALVIASTGRLADTAAVYVADVATLTLNAVDTFGGLTNDGTVIVNANVTLGTTAPVTGDAISLQNNGTITLAANVTVTADFVDQNAGTLGATGVTGDSILASTYNLNGGVVNTDLATVASTLNVGGNVTLNGSSSSLTVNVNDGALTLGSAQRLNDNAALNFGATTNGALVLGGAETVGSLAGGNASDTIDVNGSVLTLAGNGNGTVESTTFGGVISNGALTKNGLDTQILTGANTYTGTTQVNAGTLTLDGSSASLTLDVNNGTLNVGGTSAATLVDVDAGTLNVTALGTLNSAAVIDIASGASLNTSANDQLANAADLIIDGALTLGGSDVIDSLAGAGTGTIALGANTLSVGSVNGGATFAGVISGTGGFTKLGTGTQVLSGANTYAGTTTVEAGVLTLSGSSSSLTLDVNGGTLNVGGTSAATLVDVDAGTLNVTSLGSLNSAAVIDIASGATLTTSAINQLADAADVTVNGTLTLGGADAIDALAGSGTITLGANILTVGSVNGGDTYSGTLSGTGGLTKNGTGLQILTGTSNYTGLTTVNAGTLRVNGNIATSDVVVNNGGTLQGLGGTVGDLTVNAGGTVAPGASPGTLTVAGNYTTAGILQIELATASSFDRLVVTGAVQLGGSLNLVQYVGGFEPTKGQAFQVLDVTGDNINGQFATVNNGAFSNGLLFDLADGTVYGTGLAVNNAFLGGVDFAGYGTTANQDTVLTALGSAAIVGDQQFDSSTGIGLALLEVLTTNASVAATELSPEAYAGVTDYGIRATRNYADSAMTSAPVAISGDFSFFAGYAAYDGGSNSSVNNADYDLNSDGVVAGARMALNQRLSVGVFGAFDEGKISAPTLSGDVEGTVFGVFGEYAVGANRNLILNASVSVGDFDTDATRRTLLGTATADGIGSDVLAYSLGADYILRRTERTVLKLDGRLAFAHSSVDAIAEQGAADRLSIRSIDEESIVGELGFSGHARIVGRLSGMARVGVAHDIASAERSLISRFSAGGNEFTTRGEGMGVTELSFTTGLAYDVTDHFVISASIKAGMADDAQNSTAGFIGAGVSF